MKYKNFGSGDKKNALAKSMSSTGSYPPSDAKSNCNYGNLAKGVGKRTGQKK